MKVLVTGGAGFIGSHLVRLLQAEGEQVAVVDNFTTGLRENLPEGTEIHECDVTSEALGNIFEAGHFDAVVHLAGQTTVHVSMADPELDGTQNVVGSIHVLEQARRYGVQRVIFASTAASYGDVPEDHLPIDEFEPLRPLSFYGLSKVTVEHYLDLYHKAYGLDYVVLRFANVYGERQGDGGEGGVISIFARRIAEGKDITIYGDGGQTRDFIYAGDIARGIDAALRTEHANRAYNLSTQTETSLKELVAVFSKAAGKNITPNFAEARKGDIYQSLLANGRARRSLAWEPQTSLEEGLRRTYEYFLHK
ncbi:MAG: NAD-dependent epimerase/dehydratase family protein [Selenomonas sp.]|uniref:NAD-dependent epimerase/dehydratase family protein n=1 Tax=Selenomonas sp. TaxID=2053611 RepID=UPI0025E8B67B|nr:NAD-dependent epimerase/dehydratase family protein [Selenomonas sp.]MCI6099820.1 NAD-dependent epimerase/dehydratase family protein [Selenomonas sp.]MCI6231351.1 NAD-dependent epimerase/dehydratase family protein [Selenomonas sp.]